MGLLAVLFLGHQLTKGKSKSKGSNFFNPSFTFLVMGFFQAIGQVIQLIVALCKMAGKGINKLRDKSEQIEKKKKLVITPISPTPISIKSKVKPLPLPSNVILFSNYQKVATK